MTRQMRFQLSTDIEGKLNNHLLVAVFDSNMKLFVPDDSVVGHALRKAQNAYRTKKLKREFFQLLDGDSGIKAVLVYASSLLKAQELPEKVKIFAARSLSYTEGYGFSRISFLLNTQQGGDFIGSVVEGYELGGYRFDRYMKDKGASKLPLVTIVTRPEDRKRARQDIKRFQIVSHQVNRARDIVNEPGDVVYPMMLSKLARKIANEGKLACTILNKVQLERQGYQGLLAVGKGSIYPPCLIVLRYRPGKKSKHHLALLGKGITFDTGGISIKPSAGMWEMKGDMAGGAAVLSAMAAIAKLKPSVAVTGIVAAAENFPGPKAQRPGDIFVAKNGKSVMVDNTDAEGRLVLTDALARAGEEKATHIVDAATLTGSVIGALGTSVAGIMGNDKKLVSSVIDVGSRHGEAYWELPLVEEYKEALKTPYADLNNIGGKFAGAITAGLFLQEFVPEGASWAHLDIAGPFILEKPWKYYPAGATGFGVKTMVALAELFDEMFS